jgi:hypothetical protein
MNRSTTPPSRSAAPQTAADVLGRTSAFTALRAGVAQMRALLDDLNGLLPDYLVHRIEPGFIKEGELPLFTAHNALAARLRQIEPRLLAELQARGWPVSSIRVRIRPPAMAPEAPAKQARMSAAGSAALQALTESLEPSPLRQALTQMLARHQGKR